MPDLVGSTELYRFLMCAYRRICFVLVDCTLFVCKTIESSFVDTTLVHFAVFCPTKDRWWVADCWVVGGRSLLTLKFFVD